MVATRRWSTAGPRSTLTRLDLAASALLASSDRWADDAVHSRDLIDLAMMRLDRTLLRAALGAWPRAAELPRTPLASPGGLGDAIYSVDP